MRRLLLLTCAALTTPALGEDVASARRQAEASRLLRGHVASLADDISGFNRRNTLCAREAAVAAAAYGASHAAGFTRTIGWRWDARRSRWLPAAPDKAEILLIYKGTLRSEAVEVDGHDGAVCRAETPSELEASALLPFRDNERSWVGDIAVLPKLASALTAHATDALGTSASTPPTEREARIAKARALLDAEAERLRSRAAAGGAPSDCTAAIKSTAHLDSTESLHHDAARDRWTETTDAHPDVALETKTPWDRTSVVPNACLPFRPVTLLARARWQSEGDIVLTFRLDLPGTLLK